MSTLGTIIPKLIQKTIDNRIPWEEFSNGGFYTELGDFTITVEGTMPKMIDGDFYNGYRVTLRNSYGKIVEATDPSDLETVKVLNQLFELARRRAFKVDESMRQVENLLDQL